MKKPQLLGMRGVSYINGENCGFQQTASERRKLRAKMCNESGANRSGRCMGANSWPSSNPPPGPCGLRRTSGLHLAFVEPSRFFSGFVLAFCIGLRRTPSPFVEPPGLRRTFARPPGLRRASSRPVGIPSFRRSSPAILLFGHPDVFSP